MEDATLQPLFCLDSFFRFLYVKIAIRENVQGSALQVESYAFEKCFQRH